MTVLITIIGWTGAIGLLVAFYLNARNKIDSQSKMYIWMNLISALLLVGNAYLTEAWPFFVINIFWVLVSIFSLIKGKKS